MNTKSKKIISEYNEAKPIYTRMADIVSSKLKEIVKDNHIGVLAIEHRIKTEESLKSKLELKGDKYSIFEDITDILGARIICFFSDDVDKVAALIEKEFEVDWDKSVDKRAQLNPDSFGYLSLHYICSLRPDCGYDDDLCGRQFEVQIRSTLQHTWAAIEYDIGYKSEFGVPRTVIRDFSRVAGLLEIADNEFVNIRNAVNNYRDDIRKKIANNEAENVLIDTVSLREYMLHNKAMRKFLSEIASLCGAEINDVSSENYIEQLAWLGKKTIGDLEQMMKKDKELALLLANNSLGNSDIDILGSNIGLRFICRADLLNNGYSFEKVCEFLKLSIPNTARCERHAKHLMDTFEKIKES